jgi:hypothetical protein
MYHLNIFTQMGIISKPSLRMYFTHNQLAAMIVFGSCPLSGPIQVHLDVPTFHRWQHQKMKVSQNC